jgi:hypothetical protein
MNYATTSGMANPLTPAAEDQRFTALGPKRVQLSRAKGWRMPENTVKVTRPGPWGNPFVVWYGADAFGVDRWHVSHGSCHWQAESKEVATVMAVQKHEHWLRSWLADQIVAPHHVLHELRGKNLACWCAAGSPCHADTLLRYANPERHNAKAHRLP